MSRLCFDEQLVGQLQPLNNSGSFFSRNLNDSFPLQPLKSGANVRYIC